MHRIAKYSQWLKVIFVGVFGYLTYLLLIELAPKPESIPYEDKIQHMIAFGGVVLIGLLALPGYWRHILIGMAVYGGVMEVMQWLFTTTRHASVYDWLADIAGILLAWAVYSLYIRVYHHGRI